MSWITLLSKAYDDFYEQYGTVDENKGAISNKKRPFLPLYHKEQKVALEIILDKNSDVINIAYTMGKKDGEPTIIPCSMESGNRAGAKIIALPLVDNIPYVAGDLDEILTEADKKMLLLKEKKELKEQLEEEGAEAEQEIEVKKEKQNKSKENVFKEKNEAYLQQLKEWSESEFATEKLKIIYKYLSRQSVIVDLAKFGFLQINDNKLVVDEVAKNILKCFVRFRVNNGDEEEACGFDTLLYKSWQNFYLSKIKQDKKDLCYETLTEQYIPAMHDKYIRNTGDGGKLLSGNDETGFTYRGRFKKANEAATVGMETSAKAHSALKWLISRQAFYAGDFYFLVWSNASLDAPNYFNDDSDEDLLIETLDNSQTPTGDAYAWKVSKALSGYQKLKETKDDVIMLGLDSASKGRVAVVYFDYMSSDDYLNRIDKWYDSLRWTYNFWPPKPKEKPKEKSKEKNKEKNPYNIIITPKAKTLFEAIYGRRALDGKVVKKFYKQINHCLLKDQPIPFDFVKSATYRTAQTCSFKNKNGKFEEGYWLEMLSTTCALIRKYYEKEDYSMQLEEDRKTRGYVYGRLLAVADYTEERALRDDGINRQTTAMRVFNNFAQAPASTWKIIRTNLNIYFAKIKKSNSAYYYKNLIDEITNLLSVDEMKVNTPLDVEYLIGYSHQKMDLRNWKKDEQENNNEQEKNNEEGEK